MSEWMLLHAIQHVDRRSLQEEKGGGREGGREGKEERTGVIASRNEMPQDTPPSAW